MKRSVFYLVLFSTLSSWADNYHYREILVGERAAGLGGAYTAISDDPSGIWHNPAGIIFSFENYFSLSANVYASTTEVFKSAVAGRDYKYVSAGLIPSFFGFTQNYNKSKWGFGIVVPNDDRYDQDDDISGISSSAGAANTFLRKFYRQNTSTAVGLAWATELAKNFTIGASGFGVYRVDKSVDNQVILFNQGTLGVEQSYLRNISINQTVYSFLPKLGFQWMPKEELALGLTVSKKFMVSSSGLLRTVTKPTAHPPAGSVAVDLPRTAVSMKPRDPSPVEVSTGVAYFPNPSLLLSGDFYFYSDDPAYEEFKVVSTWNAALGMEYYFTEKAALRLGLSTNNANTPPVGDGLVNQAPHVDITTLSLGYSFTSEGSTFSIGGSYGYGKGKGQAIGDSLAIQDLVRTSTSIFLTGSYQM